MKSKSYHKIPCFYPDGSVNFYTPQLVSTTDYYAFGQTMPGRSFNSNYYRYGMNSQDKDYEIFEEAYSAEFWEYDSRLGKRWNIDPVETIGDSPYLTFANNPILFSDPFGDKIKWPDFLKRKYTKGNFRSMIKNGWKTFSKNIKGLFNDISNNINKGTNSTKQRISNFDWYKTLSYILRPWGNLDFGIGNNRYISRQYRGLTRILSPFYKENGSNSNNNVFKGFPLPEIGLSIGLRFGNFVLFDIKIGDATARWEDYFPGNESSSGNKIEFFNKISPDDPSGSYYPSGTSHPFFLTGKNWQVPCLLHGRFGRGMGGHDFINTLKPNHGWLPFHLIKRIIEYSQSCMSHIRYRTNKRYHWF